DALAVVVEGTGARRGYLELTDDREGRAGCWWIARGCSAEEVDDIRAAISRGIVAQALATGETVVTPSAMLDPRFRSRESVTARRIEAVLCVPIASDRARGVVYLQGGHRAAPFDEQDRECAELFAHHVAPYADRLVARDRNAADGDATRRARERLALGGGGWRQLRGG